MQYIMGTVSAFQKIVMNHIFGTTYIVIETIIQMSVYAICSSFFDHLLDAFIVPATSVQAGLDTYGFLLP